MADEFEYGGKVELRFGEIVTMDYPYQYLILHKSCLNHPGVLAVQAAHASSESIKELPVPNDTRVVALQAERTIDLAKLSNQLTQHGFSHVAIEEPDEPYNGAIISIGCALVKGGERDRLRTLLEGFKLIR